MSKQMRAPGVLVGWAPAPGATRCSAVDESAVSTGLPPRGTTLLSTPALCQMSVQPPSVDRHLRILCRRAGRPLCLGQAVLCQHLVLSDWQPAAEMPCECVYLRMVLNDAHCTAYVVTLDSFLLSPLPPTAASECRGRCFYFWKCLFLVAWRGWAPFLSLAEPARDGPEVQVALHLGSGRNMAVVALKILHGTPLRECFSIGVYSAALQDKHHCYYSNPWRRVVMRSGLISNAPSP
jgi:hypothetical protein